MLRSSFIVCILTVAMAGSAWGQDAVTPEAQGAAASGCDTACCDSACDSACDNKVGGSLFGRANKCCTLSKPRIVQACDTNACDSANCCDSRVGGGGLLRNRCRFDLRVTRNCCVLPKYVSLFVGGTTTQHFDPSDPQVQYNGIDGQFEDGFVSGIANGRYLNDKWRMESEWAYRRSEVQNPADALLGAPSITGIYADRDSGDKAALNVYSLTFNLYRDFGNARLRPYVGAGVGGNLQQMNGRKWNSPGGTIAGPSDTSTLFGVKTWGFGYQGILGLSYQTRRCNNLFVEYRYYGTSTTNLNKLTAFNLDLDTPGLPVLGAASQPDDFSVDQNMIVFGLRINR